MSEAVGIGKAINEAIGSSAEALGIIRDHIADYLGGGPDRGIEDIELGRRAGLNIELVQERWSVARQKQAQDAAKLKAKVEAEASFILPEVQPIREEPKAASVEVAKAEKPKKPSRKITQVIHAPNGNWSYLLEGETQYRRGLEPLPRHLLAIALPKPEPEEQPKIEEPKPAKPSEPGIEETGRGLVKAIVGRIPMVQDAPDTELGRNAVMYVGAMNLKHSVIGNYGGKCMVLDWVPSERDPSNLVPSFQSITSFKQRYNDRFVPTDNGLKPLGDFWLGHRDKSNYDGVIFHPGAPSVLHSGQGGEYCCKLNLWRGWGVQPKEGDWSRLGNHIKVVLAGEDEEREDYILNWTAYGYQNPGVKRRVLLGLRGPEGVGKGVFGHAIKRTYGSHGLYVTQPSHLTGKFNKHLRTCCFLFLDEAFWAGNREGEGVLKSLITDEEQMTEGKGVDTEQTMNWIDVMLASNLAWVVPAGQDARRYAIFDVDDRYGEGRVSSEERKAYFRPLWHEINNGGLEAMMFDLMKRELGDWEPQDIPKTEALMEQKQHSLRGFDRVYESFLQTGALPRGPDWDGRPDCATTEALLKAAQSIRGCEYETAASLKGYFKAMGANTKWRTPGEGRGGAKFPALPEAREIFAKKFGGKWLWVDELEKWER